MQDNPAFLFSVQGRVESRRALPPTNGRPRMEISFSGTLDAPWAAGGSAACSFAAEASPGGAYAMQGFGTLFLPEGFVLFDVTGQGSRSAEAIVYEGLLRLQGDALPAPLAHRIAAFHYRQDLTSLAVTLRCVPWPAHLSIPMNPQPENASC